MKIFIICTVRKATTEYRKKLEDYVAKLEAEGHIVHLPHRDTDQNQSGFDICKTNGNAIFESDEVHIFYNPDSQGTHFDMGMAFMVYLLLKDGVFDEDDDFKIKVVDSVELTEGKSFQRMLKEWEENQIK